jgi:hypothetical protein
MYAETGVEFTEGVILLLLGILIAGLAIYSMVSRKSWPWTIIMLASLGSLVIVILICVDIFRTSQQWQISPTEFVGIGIVVVLIGTLLTVGSASSSLRRRYY